MLKKVVITGATGFVGKYLSAYLSKLAIEVVPVSLRNNIEPACFANADIIIHLAGKAHDLKNAADPGAYDVINTGLTKQVYDIFLSSGASVFIYMSSVKAVVDYAVGMVTEQTAPKPGTAYGISKRNAEQYIEANQPTSGKKYFILRPCMIHGPGNKGNLNLLYKLIEKGIPYPLGAFDNKRSFLSIDNLCFVINQLINNKTVPQGVYNVADDISLSTNEVISEISDVLGRKPKIWKINKKLVSIMAKGGDIFHLPFNSERLGKLTGDYEVSNQKLVNALQVELPLSSREGIRKTIDAFRGTRL